MRKRPIAMSAAAVLCVTTLAAGLSLASAQSSDAVYASSAQAQESVYASSARTSVKRSRIAKHHLTRKEIRQIKKSRKWAKTAKSRSVVQCESNGDYKLVDGPYHGAWQFLTGTWLGAGGGRYAPNAHRAPKFAQDHIAWKLWRSSGWGPWGCA
ncbi:MAG: transglycosylase family protein [Candidatus Nanopelagicales bacterium]|nr:transglycosylase family protein [Candidatus Nanopelagicales bacterium]MDZ4249344.1 transglycosylase family protein [Candidatus Nanopelagicales bacterium]